MTSRHRRLVCEAWEARAMLDGRMTQKRVLWRPDQVQTKPRDGLPNCWSIMPKPGNLMWVAEPHIWFKDRWKDLNQGISFCADAQDCGSFPPTPPEVRNVLERCRRQQRDACDLPRADSRITIEIAHAAVIDRLQSFQAGDEEREGVRVLFEKRGFPHIPAIDQYRTEFNRRYGQYAFDTDGRALVLTFKVIAQPINAMLRQRAAA